MAKRIELLGRAMAVTLTAGLAFGLAGCGDEAAPGLGYANKDKVVEGSGSNAALTKDDIISVSYQAAMEAGSAHMAMTMKGAASMSAEGDVTYDAAAPEMQMTVSMPQLSKGRIEMRFVDKVIYMQLPGMTPAGKFVAIDPLDSTSPLGKSFKGLTDQMDPLSSVKSMEKAVTRVDRVGEATVDGARVDHYQVAVDTAEMMKDLEQRDTAGIPESVTYDMWLDDDNLIRKMSFDVSGAQVEMLLSDWGQQVAVARPAAGDIVKAPGA